ncbi:MAG: tetratricopeptide repeat protein [Psychrobium sp.]|nr:tetratricopeptide repeat protein [Psychrobium sp.]
MDKNNQKSFNDFLKEVSFLFNSNQLKDALHLNQQALLHFPFSTTLLSNMGSIYLSLKDIIEAKKYLVQALASNPFNEQANNNLALIYRNEKNYQQAIKLYRTLLKKNHKQVKVSFDLAFVSEQNGNLLDTEYFYLKTIALNPLHLDAQYNLANFYLQKKIYSKAKVLYNRVIGLNKYYINAYINLSNAYIRSHEMRRAYDCLTKALLIDDNHLLIFIGLATSTKHLELYDECISYNKKSLAINPRLKAAHLDLAYVYRLKKQVALAIAHCRKALRIAPNYAIAKFNLAQLLLSQGQFSEGFALNQFRPTEPRLQRNINLLKGERWQGGNLHGKRILVHGEQGFGDNIQFMRYFSQLRSRGARHIIFVCPAPLIALLKVNPYIDEIIDEKNLQDDQVSHIDYWCLIMDLPAMFKSTLHNVPNQLPYLHAKTAQSDHWHQYLPSDGFNVGLVWRGSRTNTRDKTRSLQSLAQLKPLWNVPNVNFISLQKQDGKNQLLNTPKDQPMTELGSKINDFSDSAAIISQLDLLICVDTAVAHLAGALGIKTLLLIEYNNDWRWLELRSDSIWYPKVLTLFRQGVDKNWAKVVLAVCQELALLSQQATDQQALLLPSNPLDQIQD